MEFGNVDPYELGIIDYTMPKDVPRTTNILKKVKAKSPGKVHYGCAKWGRKEWVGLIYPKGTKEKDFLEAYAKNYDCIELNTTHYQIYPTATISSWLTKVGKDFVFCPKFYQGITHFKRLKDCKEITDAFLRSVYDFGDHRGPCFLQLHENFGPKNFSTIESYMTSLPKDMEVFLEVRHKDWYTPENQKLLGDFLEANKFGFVITDTSGRRDMMHMELTIPKAFIRFVGNNMHKTDYPRIDAWIERIKSWLDGGIREVYFMMHQHDESNTPLISVPTIKKMNEVLGTKIPVPKLLNEQTSLL
jgi:uncharacterized protein YecE (DUF72 family)